MFYLISWCLTLPIRSPFLHYENLYTGLCFRVLSFNFVSHMQGYTENINKSAEQRILHMQDATNDKCLTMLVNFKE